MPTATGPSVLTRRSASCCPRSTPSPATRDHGVDDHRRPTSCLNSGTAADLTITDGTALSTTRLASMLPTSPRHHSRCQAHRRFADVLERSDRRNQAQPGSKRWRYWLLTDGFKAGDTLQINGTDAAHTLTFVNGAATGANEISITDDVDALLAKIDGLTGGTGSKVNAGGKRRDPHGRRLRISRSSPRTPPRRRRSASPVRRLARRTPPALRRSTRRSSPPLLAPQVRLRRSKARP